MKITLIIAMILLIVPAQALAEAPKLESDNTIININLNNKPKTFKYLEIKTSKSKFRVYPCGKIEKLKWKEIHKNEDVPNLGVFHSEDNINGGWDNTLH